MDNKSNFKIDFLGQAFGQQQEEEKIELDTLAGLTGFPKEFIQKELSLSSAQEISMKELRTSMLHFLDTNLAELK